MACVFHTQHHLSLGLGQQSQERAHHCQGVQQYVASKAPSWAAESLCSVLGAALSTPFQRWGARVQM